MRFIMEDKRQRGRERFWVKKKNPERNFLVAKFLSLIGLILFLSLVSKAQIIEVNQTAILMMLIFLAILIGSESVKKHFLTEKIIFYPQYLEWRQFWRGHELAREHLSYADINHAFLQKSSSRSAESWHKLVIQHRRGNLNVGNDFYWEEALDLLQQVNTSRHEWNHK